MHAKVCVIDDVWMVVGSDNLNRRSWTHDAEISCSVIDATLDERGPIDPGGLGDGACVSPETHGFGCGESTLVERATTMPTSWIRSPVSPRSRRSADALDNWHTNGRKGNRPPGHIRRHPPEHVSSGASWWAQSMHRVRWIRTGVRVGSPDMGSTERG